MNLNILNIAADIKLLLLIELNYNFVLVESICILPTLELLNAGLEENIVLDIIRRANEQFPKNFKAASMLQQPIHVIICTGNCIYKFK